MKITIALLLTLALLTGCADNSAMSAKTAEYITAKAAVTIEQTAASTTTTSATTTTTPIEETFEPQEEHYFAYINEKLYTPDEETAHYSPEILHMSDWNIAKQYYSRFYLPIIE